jgi:hypothetical protein
MGASVYITDPVEGHRAVVAHEGFLAVGPISFNTPRFLQLDSVNTAFNFIEPLPGYRPILDAILVNADRNVSGTTGAIVEVYESTDPESLVATKDVLRFDIVKQGFISATDLKLGISEGVWLNAKTDDATINLTLIYYFVSTNGE